MRIYDLDDGLDNFIRDGKFQIEIVGEDKCWTVIVSDQKWSNELQRYVYNRLGSCTSSSFIEAYDFIASIIPATGKCS